MLLNSFAFENDVGLLFIIRVDADSFAVSQLISAVVSVVFVPVILIPSPSGTAVSSPVGMMFEMKKLAVTATSITAAIRMCAAFILPLFSARDS